MATLTRSDTLEEVFSRIETLGYAMGSGGFTSHAPMATETLVALGYHQEAIAWLDRYMSSVPHAPRPERTAWPIDPNDEASWCEALGDHDRLADWVAMFDEELENESWSDVLARWWPRLVPGFLAGLTHGLIRTAHASRVLAGESNPSQRLRRELARGLGYLAARNSPLPGRPSLQGALGVREAIAGLPEVHPREVLGAGVERRSGGRHVTDEGLEGFADAVNTLAAPADVDQALLDLTHETAGLLRNRAAADQTPIRMIAAIHSLTAPAAARMLLPHLPSEQRLPTYAFVWQVVAALSAAFTAHLPVPQRHDEHREPLSEPELQGRALEHGGAHAIKFTEACLREHRASGDPVYLFAAEEIVPVMRITDSTPGG